MNNVLDRVVREGDVTELQVAVHVRQRLRVRRILQVGLRVQHGVDLAHRRHAGLERVVELAELLHRVEEHVQVPDEGDQDADL